MYAYLSSTLDICVAIVVALSTLYFVDGFESLSPAQEYSFKIFLKNEGYDCLKMIEPIHNFTIDTLYTPGQEKQVLLDIYKATNGQEWYNQSGWNTTNETSHCYWYGISCHNNTFYVKSIVIGFNNLNGFLPGNIWKIRNLLSFCFPGNPKLKGLLENILFANMTKLQIIQLNNAAIHGRIPEGIGSLSLLQRLLVCEMNGRGLSGNLPESIGGLTDMRLMCLGGNSFIEKIPKDISNLQKLFYLDLRNSHGKLWGNLDDLFSFPNITHLFLSGTVLHGTLPKKLPDRLLHLDLANCQIKGKLPTKYPTNLVDFNVANNRLVGEIPKELFFLPHIQTIDVSQNSFSSINNGQSWQDQTGNKSFAKYVSFARNRNLSIAFESFLDIFKYGIDGGGINLSILNASFCDIESFLPAQLQHIDSLLICDFKENRFYGHIPEFDVDFCYLTYLDLSSNNLSGHIPKTISSLISLQYLDVSSNPAMEQQTDNILEPDFSRMTRPVFEDNFTCPEGKITSNNGRVFLDPTFYQYKYCICDSGFYGDSGLCKQCMQGGTCSKIVVKTINDLQPNTMKLLAGYWPSPSFHNVTHLVQCSVPNACNPHGDCTCILQTLNNLTYTTRNHTVSSKITKCNISCICHKGNTDRFCSRCRKGFYKTGGLCYPCPKTKDNINFYIFIPLFAITVLVMVWSFLYFKAAPKTAFIIVAVEFLLVFLFTMLEMMPAWVFKLDVVIFVLYMSNRSKAARSLIKIAVFHIQTLDSMVSTVDVWPRQVFAIQHYISSFWNLHFSSFSCELSILFSPVGKFAFVLLLPIICMIFIGLYLMIFIVYNKLKYQGDHIQAVKYTCRRLTMSCLNFTYFPIVQATVSVLRPCDNDHGIRFMPKTPWIECDSQTYRVLSIMGWLSVVFYVIGFPFILFSLMFVLYRKRPFISDEEKRDMDSWLGSVYLQYKPKYQLYFEFVLVFRRLLLAIALSVLASLGSVQTVVVWLILVVSAIIQVRLQPFETSESQWPLENAFEFVILFVLSVSFVVLRLATLDRSFTTMFVWSVMIVNGCVLVGLITGVMYLFGLLRIPLRCRKSTAEDDDRSNGQPNGAYEQMQQTCQ